MSAAQETVATEAWIKSGCLVCEYTDYAPEDSPVPRDRRCPNDGSVLLSMDGLIVADDIITVARLLVKADREKREGQRLIVASRADLYRVNDLINRRLNDLLARP